MKKMLCIALATALCGCATHEVGKSVPDLTFAKVVAEPVYVSDYEIQPAPAYTQGQFPQGFVTDPGKNIYDFLQHRYKAAGAQGKLKISIVDVTIDHSMKDSSNAVGAMLNVAKSDVYNIQAVLRIETFHVGHYETQKVDLKAQQNISFSEHVSLAEREKLQIEAVNDLIDDLDKEMQRVLKTQLQITGPVL